MLRRETDLWLLNCLHGSEIRRVEQKKANWERPVSPNIKYFPGCDKDLKIDTTIFYSGDYDSELTIHVTCGDLDVKSEGEFAGCLKVRLL